MKHGQVKPDSPAAEKLNVMLRTKLYEYRQKAQVEIKETKKIVPHLFFFDCRRPAQRAINSLTEFSRQEEKIEFLQDLEEKTTHLGRLFQSKGKRGQSIK